MKTEQNWMRIKDLRTNFGWSPMTLHRIRKNSALKFPTPHYVNKIPYWDIDAVNEWMAKRPTTAKSA